MILLSLFTCYIPGPGNCLGLLAAKTGPTAVRGQYYGVAAAIGKVGAFVGTWGMFYGVRYLTRGLMDFHSIPSDD
jgi:hypothetical protein